LLHILANGELQLIFDNIISINYKDINMIQLIFTIEQHGLNGPDRLNAELLNTDLDPAPNTP
jgi:hypothetical protein